MSIKRIVKSLIAIAAVVVVAVVLVAVWVLHEVTSADTDKFGKVQDEAMAVGMTRDDFKAADDPWFVDMDKGLLAAPQPDAGRSGYADTVLALADSTGLDPEAIRQAAIRGQNTWTVWSGGNDRFWDQMTVHSLGTFDLLKVLSSHPDMGYGRDTRWRHLGLVNEPCFSAPTAESVAASDFGLWLDQRDAECAPDPFADAERYPGVKTGARGQSVTLTNGKTVTVPVGSAYGEPSGIMGLRLFSNPDFDAEAAKRWDPERYYSDPDYYLDKDLVRPYRVGMSCAFCHIGPSPVNPPSDPESPKFENLNSNPGAQYFWVDRIFYWNNRPREADGKPAPNEFNLIYQLFHTNPPGALDTSLVSTDYINNPRTMNAVYSVGARLNPTLRWGAEKLDGGELDNKQFQDYPQTESLAGFWDEQKREIHAARVLKDGADSVGILGALNRVYLNIGLFSEEWTLHFRPVVGAREISPIKISDAVKNSAYWGATEDQTADMAIFFLVTATPDDLASAPGGERWLSRDETVLAEGRRVFADNCAACHSSKIPQAPAETGVDDGFCAGGGNGPKYRECWDRYWGWAQTDEFKQAMREIVDSPDFLSNNFLSTERRVPADLLGINACSPLATNALKGDIWDNFSSQSYKELPAVGELTVHHPVSGGASAVQPLGAGRGYTRPASLVSLWSSAPYLQNNSVGHLDYSYSAERGYYNAAYQPAPYSQEYSGEPAAGENEGYATPNPEYAARCPSSDASDPYMPCVDNRMQVFNDSIRKMLYPELRRVDTQTKLPVPGYIYRTSAPSCLRVPKGFLPDLIGEHPGLFHRVAPWVFDDKGNIALGPLPKGFPINTLLGVKLMPDHDEPDGLEHLWPMLKAGPTLLSTFKQLGGTCDAVALNDPSTQEHAEQVLRDTKLVDTLVGLNKCQDYVVNRGHTFGADLSDHEKTALIEYLKYF